MKTTTPRNNLLRFPQSSLTPRKPIDKRLGNAGTQTIKTNPPTTKKLNRKRLERLGDFVRRIRNEKGLSLADVSKQSALFGPRISASYVNRIETDPTRNPTAASLKSLAHGLGIPVPELFAHAIRPMSREEADELALVTRFSKLSPRRKSDVLALIQVLQSGN
jgi:transcriptional regulator with XRE-family HTH domain